MVVPYSLEVNFTINVGDTFTFTQLYNLTCKDKIDEYPLNASRKSYSTIWFLDAQSLGNITDTIYNGKESNATDV